jgi:hypothetical protein
MPRVSRSTLRKLITLKPSEWAELIEAQLALIAAQIDVWRRPIGRLVVGPSPASITATALHPEAEARARRLALAVRRAAAYGVFRPLCLVRALALSRLLESNGIRGSRIRVGVRRAGRFAAHAWVECGPLVLGDAEAHTRAYVGLTDVSATPGR